jgi:hypothetical protein
MKTISLRALHREPPKDEVVQVTRGGVVVGTFVPVAVEATVPAPVVGFDPSSDRTLTLIIRGEVVSERTRD